MQRKPTKRRDGPQPPQLPQTPALAALPDAQLADHAHYTQFVLANCDLSDQTADDVLWEGVHLKRVLLPHTHFTNGQWLDVRWDVCDLSAAEWEKAHLTRVEFVGCRLLGLKLMDAELQDAVFRDCQGEWAVLWGARCERVRWEHCLLRDASFHAADLRGAVFHNCDLSHADFTNAQLTGTDFRGSQLDGLKVGLKELQGAIISPSQAIHLASLLGITVRDENEKG